MRIFNGMVRILTNVKHVPELKNLVSLDYLERNGCSFSSHARGGVLNISNEVMVVMRRTRQENNLYRLEDSVVIEDFDTVATA